MLISFTDRIRSSFLLDPNSELAFGPKASSYDITQLPNKLKSE